MSLRQLQCPACAATVSVPPGAKEVTCSYCGSALHLQRDAGETTLLLAGQVTDAIAATGAQTEAAIDENTAVTRKELRRMQYSHELASLEMRLTTVQSEIRGLQRMTHSRVTAQQLRDLQRQEAGLLSRIAEVQAILNPPAPAPAIPPAKTTKAKPAGEKKQRGCLGWGLLILAWWFFWPILLPWTMIRSHSKPIRIAGWVVAVIFTLYLLAALFASPTERSVEPEKPAASLNGDIYRI